MRLSQSDQDLTLTGTRPASACSSGRPRSGRGSRVGYVKVANSSMADELLFSSGKLEEASFEAPWGAKKDKRPILLWSPAPSSNRSARTPTPHSEPLGKPGSPSTTKKTPKIKDTMLKTRQPYRLKKSAPTFVDECLFGPRLEEPSFRAPWNVKVKKPSAKQQFISSQCNHGDLTVTAHALTKLDLRQRPRSAVKLSADSQSGAKPVWRP